MEHFVTYFNKSYIPQGLCLHDSMQKKIGDFVLWVLCLDDETYNLLEEKKLNGVRLLHLSEWEDERLLNVKKNRTFTEYCWTLTPYTPKIVFESDKTVNRVTYIDADIWFLQNPKCIFDEFDRSSKDIYITEHAYSPEFDQSSFSGKYCVQFVIFNREGGEIVRKYWEDCCIDWCFAKAEGGKFGDQKYLDEWPERFPQNIHVAQKKEWFLAPWNALRFPYSDGIVWHFHGFSMEGNYIKLYQNYKIPNPTYLNIYKPYSSLAEKFFLENYKIISKKDFKSKLYLHILTLYKAFVIYCKINYTYTKYSKIKFKN